MKGCAAQPRALRMTSGTTSSTCAAGAHFRTDVFFRSSLGSDGSYQRRSENVPPFRSRSTKPGSAGYAAPVDLPARHAQETDGPARRKSSDSRFTITFVWYFYYQKRRTLTFFNCSYTSIVRGVKEPMLFCVKKHGLANPRQITGIK